MFYAVSRWNGRRHGHTTPHNFKSQNPQLAVEIERYELTPEQEIWTLGELAQGIEFGALTEYRAPTPVTVPHYLVTLGLGTGATRREIAEKFEQLTLRLHPDVGGDRTIWVKVQRAYDRAMARASA